MDPSHPSFPSQSGHGGSFNGWCSHSAAETCNCQWSPMFPDAVNQWSYDGDASNIPQFATPAHPSGLASQVGSTSLPADTSEYQAYLHKACTENTLPHGSFQDIQGAIAQQNQPHLLPHQVYYPQPAQPPPIHHPTPHPAHGLPTLPSHYSPSLAAAHGSAHPNEVYRSPSIDPAQVKVLLLKVQCRIALEKYTRSLEQANEDAMALIKTNVQYMEAIRAAYECGYGIGRDGNLST